MENRNQCPLSMFNLPLTLHLCRPYKPYSFFGAVILSSENQHLIIKSQPRTYAF